MRLDTRVPGLAGPQSCLVVLSKSPAQRNTSEVLASTVAVVGHLLFWASVSLPVQ